MQAQSNSLASGRFSVFRVPEALSNWRAVLVIAIGAVGFALLFFLAKSLPPVLMAVFALLGVIVYLSGLSGAGACLLDQARGNVPQGIPAYLLRGLFSLPRLLGVLVLTLLAVIAVGIVAALYLFLCKIPVLGPLLLFVGIPVLVAVFAAMFAGLYVLTTLAGPAVWDGHGVITAFRASVLILTRHTWAALSKIVGGLLLAACLSALFAGFVGLAAGAVGGLGASILGASIGMGGLGSLFGGYYGGFYGGSNGLLTAGVGGFGLVFFMTFALVSLTPCMVAVLTWLEFSEKIDLVAARAEAEAALESMRQKAKDLQDKLATANMPAAGPVAPATAGGLAAAACPACGGALAAGDKFCGGCGAPRQG